MISWKFKTYGPIGLDIGNHSIKMIQLSRRGGQTNIFASDEVQIVPAVSGDEQARRDFIVSSIREMLDRSGFYGRDVVSCIPNDKLKVTSLRLPQSQSSEIEEVLKSEMSERFGLDADKDSMHYIMAGNVRQGDEIKSELILFAVASETIRDHIEMLEDAELRPVGLDAVACALVRNFERLLKRQDDKNRTVVFVDLGSRFSTVVFGRGGEICFIKQIPIGGEKLTGRIASRLGVNIEGAQTLRNRFKAETLTAPEEGDEDEEIVEKKSYIDSSMRRVITDAIRGVGEELAREISLCFKYYTVTFRGKGIEQAYFSGGEAYDDILLESLRERFSAMGIEFEVVQPLRGFDLSREGSGVIFNGDRRSSLCEWAVAAGLALKGWNFDN